MGSRRSNPKLWTKIFWQVKPQLQRPMHFLPKLVPQVEISNRNKSCGNQYGEEICGKDSNDTMTVKTTVTCAANNFWIVI
jgi:hypothetical protein